MLGTSRERAQASGLILPTPCHRQSQDTPTWELGSFTSSWQQVVCLHNPGRGGVISTEEHLFSCGSFPRNVLLPPLRPLTPPRAGQIDPEH